MSPKFPDVINPVVAHTVSDEELQKTLDTHCENSRKKMIRVLPSDAEKNEINRLNTVVDRFAEEMKRRLRDKVLEGYSGWDDPRFLKSEDISFEANLDMTGIDGYYHLGENSGFIRDEALQMAIDVANRVMMLWFREMEGR